VETVKLSRIVMKLVPELYESLTNNELESEIILWHGLDALAEHDVMEIIQFSILEHHKDALYH